MKLESFLMNLLLIAGLVCFGPSTSVYAGTVLPSVAIDEYYDAEAQNGYFEVTNYQTEGVYAFAVANSYLAPAGAECSAGLYSAWTSKVVSKDEWDAGYNFGLPDYWLRATDTFEGITVGYLDGSDPWSAGPAVPDTSNSFETYFGTEYDRAIIYYTSLWADGYTFNNPIQQSETNIFNFSSGEEGSPFVAFNGDGEVMAQGDADVVPLPGALFLMGSGLIALVGFRKKQIR